MEARVEDMFDDDSSILENPLQNFRQGKAEPEKSGSFPKRPNPFINK